MKALLLSLAVVSLAAQSRDPANPWPNHGQPTNGWFCVRADADHSPEKEEQACRCVGMSENPCPKPEAPDDDGTPRDINDNPQCKSFCFKDHCACTMHCTDSN